MSTASHRDNHREGPWYTRVLLSGNGAHMHTPWPIPQPCAGMRPDYPERAWSRVAVKDL
jgi:hypothetical protein